MKYTVAIPIGPFAITARVAANGSGGRFYVEVAGTNVTGLVNVPATGGWQSWVTLPPRLFTNASPANSFRVVVDTGGFNLNWLRFTSLLPPAPTGLVATANSAQVNLSWQSVAGASSYKVSRVTAGGSNYVTIAHVGGTTYADAAVTNGTTVHYVVAAGNSYGESPLSSPASVEVPFPKLAVSFSPSTVRLSWSNSASSLLLRTTTSLSPPVTWLAVTNPAALQDGVWRIDWSSADAVRFFRLATE
jgi:hypothetical protein